MKTLNKKSEQITHRIYKRVGRTIASYNLIQANDRIAVALSGGKDSWAMLHILRHFQKVSPVPFQLIPVTIDPGFPDFQSHLIRKTLDRLHLEGNIVQTRIFKTIRDRNSPGKNPCAFCARLRRGALYRIATKLNCNKIALGHHADDAIETLFISGAFEGRFVSLPPLLPVHSGKLTLIRPLILVFESQLADYFSLLDIPPFQCACFGETPLNNRKKVKEILAGLAERNPEMKNNFLSALQNINPSRFLDTQWL